MEKLGFTHTHSADITRMKGEADSRGHESLAEQCQTSHSYALGVKQGLRDSTLEFHHHRLLASSPVWSSNDQSMASFSFLSAGLKPPKTSEQGRGALRMVQGIRNQHWALIKNDVRMTLRKPVELSSHLKLILNDRFRKTAKSWKGSP